MPFDSNKFSVASGVGVWGQIGSTFADANGQRDARLNGLADWISKDRYNNPNQPQKYSRHTFGVDLSKPAPGVGNRGRRETDVRDGMPGQTRYCPNAGQLEAHPHPHLVSALTVNDPPTLWSAGEALYGRPDDARPLPPPSRPQKEVFYYGSQPASHSQPKDGSGLSSHWRRGDRRRFTLDGSEPEYESRHGPDVPYNPNTAMWRMGDDQQAGGIEAISFGDAERARAHAENLANQRTDLGRGDWRQGEEGNKGMSLLHQNVSGMEFGSSPSMPQLTAGYSAHIHVPRTRSGFADLVNGLENAADKPMAQGLKLSDIHEGWQGLHRADPPAPAPNAYRRINSDITLRQSRHAKAQDARKAAQAALRERDAAMANGAESPERGLLPMRSPLLDDENAVVSHGRRRTVVSEHLEADVPNNNVNEMDPGLLEYRKQTTDIHLANYADESFMTQERQRMAANPMEGATEGGYGGRPKYGRRRYPLTLFASDFDLLKV